MRICFVADGSCVHSHRWMRYFSARRHELSFLSFQPVLPHHVAALEETGTRYLGELGPFHVKRFWKTVADPCQLGVRFAIVSGPYLSDIHRGVCAMF